MRRPGLDTCIKLSNVFDLPIDIVLGIAGYNLKVKRINGSMEQLDWDDLYYQLNSEDKKILIKLGKAFLLMREKQSSNGYQI